MSDCSTPCCDPETCRLTPGAACGSGLCCDLSSCSLAPPSRQCRPASGECDLAEYCDGEAAHCPPDVHKAPGLACSDGAGFCHSGRCGSHQAQCRLLWGDEARPSPPQCFSLNRRGDLIRDCLGLLCGNGGGVCERFILRLLGLELRSLLVDHHLDASAIIEAHALLGGGLTVLLDGFSQL